MLNSAKLRRLITQAFSEEELKIFCYDYYKPVYEQFTSTMSKPVMIQLLIEYCDRRNDEKGLIDKIKEHRHDINIENLFFNQKPIAYIFKNDADTNSQEASYNLLYTSNIIDSHSTEIEGQIGTTTDIEHVGIGFVDSIPGGGEQRWYQYRGYLLGVDYDKSGIACGIRLEGLEDQQLLPSEWHTILHRIGLSVRKQPEETNLRHMIWSNYYGHYISVILNKMGSG